MTLPHPAELAAELRVMLLDAQAPRAIQALCVSGISVVLLKGPVTAAWLYSGRTRHYGDIDLLVDPAQRRAAVAALSALGYRDWLAGADPCEFGGAVEIELIGPHGDRIDLHHTLSGVTATPQRCWRILSGRTEPMELFGGAVTVLDPVARTVHLALHAAQDGPLRKPGPLRDLQAGLDLLPDRLWRQAAELARSLEALDAFSSGLRLTESGRELAERLGLPRACDVELELRARSAPAFALQIQRFVEAESAARRARLVLRKLWPSAVYMRAWYPRARRGRTGLFVARTRRLTGVPHKLAIALPAWYCARRTVLAERVRQSPRTAPKPSASEAVSSCAGRSNASGE